MNRSRDQSGFRRLVRVATTLLLGHSLAIVVVPLTVGLAIHALAGAIRGEHEHGWSAGESFQCIGVIAALCLFALLAVSHLCVSVYTSWAKNANVSRIVATGAAHRLDAVVTRGNLLERIRALGTSRRLVGPVARKEPRCEPPVRYFYQELADVNDLAIDFPCAVYSPKSVVLPPRETLLVFDRSDGRFHAAPQFDATPTALVGVHPCDLHGIRLLDEVFSGNHRDDHYAVRRANLFIVGIDCPAPCSAGCFCRDTHTNDAESGFDVMLYPLSASPAPPDSGGRSDGDDASASDGRYGVVFGSEAGRAWLKNGDNLALADRDAVRHFDSYLAAKHRAFRRALKTPWKEVPDLLNRSYDSLVWQGTAQRCYSCGSCNLVCPTCYCFDIQDENNLALDGGKRERTWDACMLRDFAVVAGGHNFRPDAAQRLRHRIFRKGAWIQRRAGLSGCVGCGRCTRACTAHISIVDILNQLAEDDSGEHRGRATAAARGG